MTKIQLRRDSAAQWNAANPVLAAGEVGVQLDDLLIKVGDGATAWSDLDWFGKGPKGDTGPPGPKGDPGPPGTGADPDTIAQMVADWLAANPSAALADHIADPTPHTAYDDDLPSLSLIFDNHLL